MVQLAPPMPSSLQQASNRCKVFSILLGQCFKSVYIFESVKGGIALFSDHSHQISWPLKVARQKRQANTTKRAYLRLPESFFTTCDLPSEHFTVQ